MWQQVQGFCIEARIESRRICRVDTFRHARNGEGQNEEKGVDHIIDMRWVSEKLCSMTILLMLRSLHSV